jgi:transposase
MEVANRLSLDELKALAAKESDKRAFVRLRVVVLAREGGTAEAIAGALGISRRAVQRWVARYNAEGVDGLVDRARPGQPKHLADDSVERFRQRIEAGPTDDDGVCSLRGTDIQAILQREFGVVHSLSGVYALLHRLGYSCLDPRPRHRKADQEAQDDFKKKSSNRSTRSLGITLAKRWKSGSRTRRDSARKGP